MPTIQLKDIWRIYLSDACGNEQSGDCLAVVLAVHDRPDMVTVVLLTENMKAMWHDYTLQIVKSSSNGLSSDMVALVFQLQSLENTSANFKEKIGTLEDREFVAIKKILRLLLSIT